MSSRRTVTEYEKNKIIEMHDNGIKGLHISHQLNRGNSIIYRILKKEKQERLKDEEMLKNILGVE